MLKSPFILQRLGDALEKYGSKCKVVVSIRWTEDSVFRVLKAIYRTGNGGGGGLNPRHGVSCSQFFTVCYQAGAVCCAVTLLGDPQGSYHRVRGTGGNAGCVQY